MDSYGLTQVYPEKDKDTECKVDIVAIHGLDTTSDRTWKAYRVEGDFNSDLVHWLKDKDMLPSQVRDARIFTYDWNAKTFAHASDQYFYHHAELFLDYLDVYRQGKFEKNPLVFIASCYGGLILAKALYQASSRSSRFSHLLDATYAVAFLGTPFRGSKGTPAAQIRVRIANVRGQEANDQLLRVLDSENGLLDETRDRFSELALDMWSVPKRMVFFYETQKTQVAKAVLSRSFLDSWAGNLFSWAEIIVVDEESARIPGWPKVPIDRNHAMLNKFRGPEDRDFLRVARWITAFVEDALGELVRKNTVEMKNDMLLAETDLMRNRGIRGPSNQHSTRPNKAEHSKNNASMFRKRNEAEALPPFGYSESAGTMYHQNVGNVYTFSGPVSGVHNEASAYSREPTNSQEYLSRATKAAQLNDPDYKGIHRFRRSRLPPNGRQTRLVRLIAGHPEDPRIQCEIFHRQLDWQGRMRKGNDSTDTYSNELENEVEYETLSWSRSKESPEFLVLIRKQSNLYYLPVPRELILALRNLRQTLRDRILWIDELCVEHEDIEDRNSHFELMPLIYGGATQLCIWLGDGTNGTSDAVSFIQEIATDPSKLYVEASTSSFDLNSPKFQSLSMFVQHSWFMRRWSIPELSLSPNASLQCGPGVLSWDSFGLFVKLISEFSKDESPAAGGVSRSAAALVSGLSGSLLFEVIDRVFRSHLDSDAGTSLMERRWLQSLEYLVSNSYLFESDDPRDNVYSLVAVARDARPMVPSLSLIPQALVNLEAFLEQKSFLVDYSQPYTDVCKDFLSFCIQQSVPSRSLDIIFRPWASEPLSIPTPLKRSTSRRRYNLPKFFNDNKSNDQYWRNVGAISEPHELLIRRWEKWIPTTQTAEGRPVSEQKANLALPSWVQNIKHAPFALVSKTFSGLRQLSRTNADSLVGMPGDRETKYNAAQNTTPDLGSLKFRRRTVLGHYSLYVKGFILDEVKTVAEPSRFGSIPLEWTTLGGWKYATDGETDPPREFWRTLVADRGMNGEKPPSYFPMACKLTAKRAGFGSGVVDTTTLIQEEGNSIAGKFCRRVQAVIWNRCLIRTRQGRLGLVRPDVRPGDLICILYGCSVPVILRQHRKTAEDFEGELFEDGFEAMKSVMAKLEQKYLRKKMYRSKIENLGDGYEAHSVKQMTADFNERMKRIHRNEYDIVRDDSHFQYDEDFNEHVGRWHSYSASEDHGVRSTSHLHYNEDLERRKRSPEDSMLYYTIMGESYIDGMMEGEAMRRKNDEELRDRNFELR